MLGNLLFCFVFIWTGKHKPQISADVRFCTITALETTGGILRILHYRNLSAELSTLKFYDPKIKNVNASSGIITEFGGGFFTSYFRISAMWKKQLKPKVFRSSTTGKKYVKLFDCSKVTDL